MVRQVAPFENQRLRRLTDATLPSRAAVLEAEQEAIDHQKAVAQTVMEGIRKAQAVKEEEEDEEEEAPDRSSQKPHFYRFRKRCYERTDLPTYGQSGRRCM